MIILKLYVPHGALKQLYAKILPMSVSSIDEEMLLDDPQSMRTIIRVVCMVNVCTKDHVRNVC